MGKIGSCGNRRTRVRARDPPGNGHASSDLHTRHPHQREHYAVYDYPAGLDEHPPPGRVQRLPDTPAADDPLPSGAKCFLLAPDPAEWRTRHRRCRGGN